MMKKIVSLFIVIMFWVQPASASALLNKKNTEFLNGNAIWALLQKTGEALIDIYNLPVIGRTRDAADNFATISLNERGDIAHQHLEHARYGWVLLNADQIEELDETNLPLEYYDWNASRSQHILCYAWMLTGIDHGKFLETLGYFSRFEQRVCQADAEKSLASWRQLLAPYLLKAGQKNSQVNVEYAAANAKLTPYRNNLQAAKTLEWVANHIQTTYKLPHDLTLTAQTCDELYNIVLEPLFWDKAKNQITICYQFLHEYDKLISANQPDDY